MSRQTKYPNRQRCLSSGCNPFLLNINAADAHKAETGHRTAKWPVRSAEGKRRARIRSKTGYYDKYNVGAKSASVRGIIPGVRGGHISDRDSGVLGLTAADMADNGRGDS